jgi:LuxR family maltose regulon positive regulatory protein
MAVQSVAYYAHGEKEKAVDLLAKLLALTGPEDCIRPFLEEGELMRLLIVDFRLLIEKKSRDRVHPQSGFVDKILTAFDQQGGMSQSKSNNLKSKTIDPLSARELEVLRLLRSELSGPEIAKQLIVSLNTLRTHTKNIFNKLGVNNRRAAVSRAEELDLF